MLDAVKILREAVDRVPAMKYALAIAGLLAVLAIAGSFKLYDAKAAIAVLLLIGGMVVFVLFVAIASLRPGDLRGPARLLLWFVTLMALATAAIVFSSAFFNMPSQDRMPWATHQSNNESKDDIKQSQAVENGKPKFDTDTAKINERSECTGPILLRSVDCLKQ